MEDQQIDPRLREDDASSPTRPPPPPPAAAAATATATLATGPITTTVPAPAAPTATAPTAQASSSVSSASSSSGPPALHAHGHGHGHGHPHAHHNLQHHHHHHHGQYAAPPEAPTHAAAAASVDSHSHQSPSTTGLITSPGAASQGVTTYGTPHTPLTPTTAHLGLSHDTPPAYDANGNPFDPNDPKRPRACEACRGLKVKCEPDLANPDGPCKRCAKAGRNCVVTQPTRKRQKKTDSRVAELEKKIDALTASLHASRGTSGPAAHPSPEERQDAFTSGPPQQPPPARPQPQPQPQLPMPSQPQHPYPHGDSRSWGALPAQDPRSPHAPGNQQEQFATSGASAGQKRKFDDRRTSADVVRASPGEPTPHPHQQQPPQQGEGTKDWFSPDTVDRGILTMDQANGFFARYTSHMVSHLPAVVFPPGTTAADLRRTKPALFLSIMATASSEVPSIHRPLSMELTQYFADRVFIHGEKSLELVQALQVSVVWYHPPENFEELKFYQMVHLGAVMAIDIGLGRRRNNPKSRFVPYTWQNHPFRKTPLPDPSSIECRRAWLASYFLASNVAMALHRPNLIRWTSFMTECMDILESSPEAFPSDKYLCHLVWTHRLAEEVGIQFSMDDPGAFVNIAEPKVQYALRGFERDLAKYNDGIPPAVKQPSLLLSFHVLSLYMHEIALYVEKPNESVQSFNTEVLRDPVPGLNEALTAAHIGALSSCLTAIDGIFETFLSMDVRDIRCLPVFNFVRVAYAVVVLIKIYFSASTPNSELGKVINKDNMKVEEYLEKLLDKFRETAANEKSRPGGKFIVVLSMLRGWFQKPGKGSVGDQANGQSEPMPGDAAGSRLNEQQIQQQPPPPQKRQTQQPHQPRPLPQQHPQQQQQQQHQPHQPQHQQQAQPPTSRYDAANTPLQLLSEIATGNGAVRDQNGAADPAGTRAPYQPWLAASQPFLYDPTTGVPTGVDDANHHHHHHHLGGVSYVMPYLNNTLTGDFDYSALGDGFEQAMGLTFGGFPGAAPDDYLRYDDGMVGSLAELPPGSMPFQF